MKTVSVMQALDWANTKVEMQEIMKISGWPEEAIEDKDLHQTLQILSWPYMLWIQMKRFTVSDTFGSKTKSSPGVSEDACDSFDLRLPASVH